MQHFKLSAYNKVQATGKQINQFQYIVVAKAT